MIWTDKGESKGKNEVTLNLVQTLEQPKSIYLSNEEIKRLFCDDWWYDVRMSLSSGHYVSKQICSKVNET